MGKRKQRYSGQLLFGLLLFLKINISFSAFECPIGTNAACLNWGDRVVDQFTVCFDGGQCPWDQFVCKSQFDEVINDYNSLVSRNQNLVDEYNDLLRDHRSLRGEYSNLIEEYNQLVNRYNNLLAR